MNNQTPTAQSGPSDPPKLTMKLAELPEWIERTIQDIQNPIFNYTPADIANGLQNMLTVLAETPQEPQSPPAGARDAVTGDMVERACVSFLNDWSNFHQHEREQFRKVMRAALGAALAGKTDGTTCTQRNERVLAIQLREVETAPADSYMRGLYNGMLMICCNEDGTEYQPAKKPPTQPAAPGMGESEIRRVIHELRTYNPIADEYKGVHIHSVWARELEAALAAQPAPAGIEGAIATLVDALSQGKGWLRDYADGVIRDAIERTAQPAPVVGGDETVAVGFIDRSRDGYVGRITRHDLVKQGDQLFTQWPLSARPAESVAQPALLAARPGGETPIGYVDAGDLQGLTLGHYSKTSLHNDRRDGDVPVYANPAQAGGGRE